jgi:hypothetical protein
MRRGGHSLGMQVIQQVGEVVGILKRKVNLKHVIHRCRKAGDGVIDGPALGSGADIVARPFLMMS